MQTVLYDAHLVPFSMVKPLGTTTHSTNGGPFTGIAVVTDSANHATNYSTRRCSLGGFLTDSDLL